MPAEKLSSDLVNTTQDWKGTWCPHVGAGGGVPHPGPTSVLVMQLPKTSLLSPSRYEAP